MKQLHQKSSLDHLAINRLGDQQLHQIKGGKGDADAKDNIGIVDIITP